MNQASIDTQKCRKHHVPLEVDDGATCDVCGGDGEEWDDDPGAPGYVRCYRCGGDGIVTEVWCEWCEMEEN